jgi:hypothetical protein
MADATRYVNLESGNDGSDGLGTGTAWLTWGKALQTSPPSVGDGFTYTIKFITDGTSHAEIIDLDDSGDYHLAGRTLVIEPYIETVPLQTNCSLTGTKAVTYDETCTAGTQIFRGIEWAGTYDFVQFSNTGSPTYANTIRFERCTGVAGSNVVQLGSGTTYTGDMYLTACDFTSATYFGIFQSWGSLTIEHCHCTATQAASATDVLSTGLGNYGDLTITDCVWSVTLTGTGHFLNNGDTSETEAGLITFPSNATWTIARNVFDFTVAQTTGIPIWVQRPSAGSAGILNVNISGNKITADTAARTMRIGAHLTAVPRYQNGYEVAGTFGTIVVSDNIIINEGGSDNTGDTLLIGVGADDAEIVRNFIRGGTAAGANTTEIIGNDCEFYGNVCVGVGAIVVMGDRAHVHHNTAVSADDSTLRILAPSGDYLSWEPPTGGSIHHNIIVCSSSNADDGCITTLAGDYGDKPLFNWNIYSNCYYPGDNASVGAVDGATQTALADLQAKWATFNRVHPDSDQDSIETNPDFADITKQDRFGFAPTEMDLYFGDGDYVGAISPAESPKVLSDTAVQDIQAGLARQSANSIYYAAVTGNDGNDGLTPAAAKTLTGAVAAAGTAGDIVVVMPGAFATTVPLSLTAGVRYIGAGKGVSVVTFTNNTGATAGVVEAASNVTIRGMSLIGVAGDAGTYGVEATGALIDNITLADLRIEATADDVAISFTSGVGRSAWRVAGCDFYGTFDGFSVVNATADRDLIATLLDCVFANRTKGVNLLVTAGTAMVYACDCRFPGEAGQTTTGVSAIGASATVALMGSEIIAEGGAHDSDITAGINASVYAVATNYDRDNVTTATGGTITDRQFGPTADTVTWTIDGQTEWSVQ